MLALILQPVKPLQSNIVQQGEVIKRSMDFVSISAMSGWAAALSI